MKENKYDAPGFFDQYSRMARSTDGLEAAGEWYALRRLLPDFRGKRVLDLGCGFGWHCRYAVEQGAASVIGTDISEKMLAEAKRKTTSPLIAYERVAMEDIDYPPASFEIVLSSLAFHYIECFPEVCRKVYAMLSSGGDFVFSVEHPVFTAYGKQDWYRDTAGNKLHWPVDRYFIEGWRDAVFLGEPIRKCHRTLTTYVNTLIKAGFAIAGLVEPEPSPHLLETVPEMTEEFRRPMMLLVSAHKQ